MFCVFNEGALRPSNYLRMASEGFKGINDNNQSGEGVYFRFVKDCKRRKFKWSNFFANVCGKGVGGGVIYFMPRIMACGLKFMHASGIDNGGKKVNSFVTVENDAKMRDTIEGIFKTKKGIKNYPKENQTEIAFNDGVDLNRITDIFVSVSKIKEMRENLKSSLTSYNNIIKTCIKEKQLKDETKKIIIENYYSGTKNKNYKEVLLKQKSVEQESLEQESLEQDKEVSYKNKVTELLFDKICPFPTLDNNYYAYKKTKEYYWFATDNGLKITTPDKSNLKKNKLDLNKCIIISWLNRVVDVLGSIVENPEKREEKYEDFKLNSQKEIKNVEIIRTKELESQGSKEDTYCCKNIDDSIPLYIESESEKTKIDSTSSKPKQDNKLVVSK
jgi:hypothetical protein